MIDVHVPHKSEHTWTDFFIHLGIVVLGILIAIGLEQTVEYIHRRHQLTEVRAQLAVERDLNRKVLERNQYYADRMQAELARDMNQLHQRSISPSAPLDNLHYVWYFLRPLDGAWISARENGSLSLMPDIELHRSAYRYEAIETYLDVTHQFEAQIEIAGGIAARAKPADLSPQDIHDLVVATSEAQGRLALVQQFLLLSRTRALNDDLNYSFLDQPPGHDPSAALIP